MVRIFTPQSSYDVALSWLGPQEGFDLPKETPLELSLSLSLPLPFCVLVVEKASPWLSDYPSWYLYSLPTIVTL